MIKIPIFPIKFFIILVTAFHVALFFSSVFFINALKKNNPHHTAYMLYRTGYNPGKLRSPAFIPLGKVPLDVVRCTIYIEDFRFYNHPGFDIDSIEFAIKINRKLGYMAYGGSTITQQLARNLFLSPHKNYIRKYMEILLAVEIDLFLSKARILELYLNYAEWGDGVFGIREASQYHFGRDIRDTTGEDRLKLLSILPSPLSHSIENFMENRMLRARYNSLERYHNVIKKIPPKIKSKIIELN